MATIWDASIPERNAANAGLFKNRYLTKPEGFQVFARRNLEKATVLVHKVLTASSVDEYRAVVKHLDRLSDLLCRVLDLCDFVRMTHPDQRFQAAASDAWAMVYQYMNQLNTTTGLNDQLCTAMRNPEVTSAWTEEEMIVAKILRTDFEKSAVHLPEATRNKFVMLSQQVSEAGNDFVERMSTARPYIEMPVASLAAQPADIQKAVARGGITRHGSTARVGFNSIGHTAAFVLRKVMAGDARRAAYLTSNTASSGTIRSLEKMLRLRSTLANLTGFDSYGHQHLSDRMMAKSPEAVMRFLQELHRHNVPLVNQEHAALLAAKREQLGQDDKHIDVVHPWDTDLLKTRVREKMVKEPEFFLIPSQELNNYFSVGTVIKGLSILFNRLYGIRFVPRGALPGEVWHSDVRRLDVLNDKGELIAVLYCDLYYREGKSPNPAHYTIRCSRDIRDDEVAEAAEDMGLPSFESPEESANDGMEAVRDDGVLKQLPTVVLTCDFARPGANKPSLLEWRNLETLFHEMGHAVHSILARTSFQNVAGTRCATDLAELPSTLMEHFASDPAVLSLFARHWKTGEEVPYQQLAARVRISKQFEGLDTERQIILAMADQLYHSDVVSDPSFDSTKVYHVLQKNYATIRDDPNTSWQGFFGHLFGYGSTYYSYLFDRVLAERVWQVVFKGGEGEAAISRENGEWLKENLLKWGGSRDPWQCMADTLRDHRIKGGDEEAMGIVGSWGLKEGEVGPEK